MSSSGLSKKDRWKARVTSGALAGFIRAVGATLRVDLQDDAGLMDGEFDEPLIWIFWHNRIFTMPVIYRRYLGGRHGAVLTSPSGDGEFIARVLKQFGVDSIRGSSNKRQVASMREMAKYLTSGKRDDVVITPDGPRGPKEVLAPGVVKLAQLTGVSVFPVHVDYARCWRLRTWDEFAIPMPFSKVKIRFCPLERAPREMEENDFEAFRLRLERLMKG
ncbi:MAG: lysophospholipid acyltransferase family protein [Verrucomicrobiota bacterium]